MKPKIAVLADIHSNHIALETCLKEAQRRDAEEYLFLGDYLGELAYPEKTLEILDQLAKRSPCVFIRGNKEDYWINHHKGTDLRDWQLGTSGSGMLRYVYDRLTVAQIELFERMPIAKKISYPSYPPFVICHGSPWKTNESLREDYDYINEKTKQLETELTICAHFHIQHEYVQNGKRVVNPGAIGVPLQSGGKTQFMMLYGHDGRWTTEFISLPYNQEAAIKEMDAEKLNIKAPGWYRITKEVLRKGTPMHLTALTRAHDLYKKDSGIDDWGSIPEKYWDMALTELDIPY